VALREAGISLRNVEDTLLWAGGDGSGDISAANLYRALITPLNFTTDKTWITKIWRWPIQLKIRLFAWLAVFDKILTWEVLQRRGWVGPGICKLCKVNSESTDHLFVHCSFTQAIWQKLYKIYHLNFQWEGNSVSDCFYKWTTDISAPASMAAIACWQIWIERNKSLFEDFSPSIDSVVHRITTSFNWQPSIKKLNINRVCELTLPEGVTMACFDGAALSNGSCCAAGGIFRTHDKRITKWYLNCGVGTNTKAELMGLWATLTLATLWAIDKIHILGDSKVIIDWINQKSQLNAVNIEGWKIKTLELARNMKNSSYKHIYREHNKEADLLSKRALKELKGRLSVFHWENGEESPHSHLNIFEA
jgi:ribonuclease HI